MAGSNKTYACKCGFVFCHCSASLFKFPPPLFLKMFSSPFSPLPCALNLFPEWISAMLLSPLTCSRYRGLSSWSPSFPYCWRPPVLCAPSVWSSGRPQWCVVYMLAEIREVWWDLFIIFWVRKQKLLGIQPPKISKKSSGGVDYNLFWFKFKVGHTIRWWVTKENISKTGRAVKVVDVMQRTSFHFWGLSFFSQTFSIKNELLICKGFGLQNFPTEHNLRICFILRYKQ